MRTEEEAVHLLPDLLAPILKPRVASAPETQASTLLGLSASLWIPKFDKMRLLAHTSQSGPIIYLIH